MRVPSEPLITSFLDHALPLETTVTQIREISETNNLTVSVWVFSPLLEGQSLQEHVQMQTSSGNCPGPYQEVVCKLILTMLLRIP